MSVFNSHNLNLSCLISPPSLSLSLSLHLLSFSLASSSSFSILISPLPVRFPPPFMPYFFLLALFPFSIPYSPISRNPSRSLSYFCLLLLVPLLSTIIPFSFYSSSLFKSSFFFLLLQAKTRQIPHPSALGPYTATTSSDIGTNASAYLEKKTADVNFPVEEF